MTAELDAEDTKLVTLARGARERIRAAHGVAVRDETGRTYAAADAPLPSRPLNGFDVVAAQAWISGSRGLEAVVIVTGTPDQLPDPAPLIDLGGEQVEVLVCAEDGSVVRRSSTGALRTSA